MCRSDRRYLANSGHNVDETLSVQAMHHLILLGKQRPKLTWTVTKDDSLFMQTDTPPDEVALWSVTNAEARDFRIETTGPTWKAKAIPVGGAGAYHMPIPRPETGWTATFVEFQYDLGASTPFVATTVVFVRSPAP